MPNENQEDPPIPESDTFRLRPRRVLAFLVPAVLLILAAVLVPGEGLLLYRGLGLLCGLILLRNALLRYLFRVRMIPDGILITGEPGLPWTAITGVQLLSVNPHIKGNGFRVMYQAEDGEAGTAYVPGSLARYSQAYSMFLEMSVRHGANWAFPESIRMLRSLKPPDRGEEADSPQEDAPQPD